MAKKAKLQLCIDRVVPLQHKAKAMDLAVGENPGNEPTLPVLLPGVSNNKAKIALFAGKMWPNGRVLRVKFLDGSTTQREKVMKHAQTWSKYANIEFDLSGGANAEIRISFKFDPGSSWSAVGTDCLVVDEFPKNEPTMNFGWLDDDTDDVEYRRVVIHEFGHALSAIHEHQSPAGGIKWNIPAVYATFSGPPNNWSKAEIDFNIIQKYSSSQLNATKFDSKSIMLYSFPPQLIIGGVGTPNNTKLSTKDKKFIANMYPK